MRRDERDRRRRRHLGFRIQQGLLPHSEQSTFQTLCGPFGVERCGGGDGDVWCDIIRARNGVRETWITTIGGR